MFAQTFQKILLTKEDNLRPLRSILRDTIRNTRLDFDLTKFTFNLLDDIRKKYPEFIDFDVQLRERYVNSIADLVTVCIFVSITPTIKDAYLKRNDNLKDQLVKYYQLMSQIQCDTVSWLQAIVRTYDINTKERLTCLFKVLFMTDKPEIYYAIDNWPPEVERAVILRIVSEIPVMYETLYQILLMADSGTTTGMALFTLEVEERLLKTQAHILLKEKSCAFRIENIEHYLNALFRIAFYKYPVEYESLLPRDFKPPKLVVSILYWKIWQIILILCVLDPKEFGFYAWNNYPILKLLVEMIITEDYNFPTQTSITAEMTVEKYRTLETQVGLGFAHSAERSNLVHLFI